MHQSRQLSWFVVTTDDEAIHPAGESARTEWLADRHPVGVGHPGVLWRRGPGGVRRPVPFHGPCFLRAEQCRQKPMAEWT